MAKFTSADVSKLAERLKRAKDRKHPAHFLIGAGCSISAGIPGAADLIKKIHVDYEAHCTALSNDQRQLYGACMALLSINERRDLIRPYLEAAKINWGTIALAQLMAEGYVERVLTVNFDLVLEHACGLLGLQPAVYDFGVAPASDPAMIVSPAIIHLHGQSYGLVLLNTEEETQKHRKKLQPILVDTLRNAPLVVIGYSGSADGISQNLVDEFEGREPLYWFGYADELAAHLHGFLKKKYFHFLGGADFDRFMIELAQSLGCWPPHLFSDPLGHLLRGLGPVIPYPTSSPGGEIDLLGNLRRKLQSLQQKQTEDETKRISLKELYMKGDYEAATRLFSSWPDRALLSAEDREIAYWSFVTWGDLLLEQAERASGEAASRLFVAAGEKYASALAIKPDGHEALNSWGTLLSQQAERASGEEASRLFAAASEKYAAALAIEPDQHEALNNWGNLLLAQAKRASGEEASRLFALAGEKYAAALAIKPDKQEALSNWGALLSEQAERASGEKASRLFAAAGEKYAAALAIKPDDHEALNNWGNLLLEQAKRASGGEASRLFAVAEEKLKASMKIDSSMTYNLACLAAIRGNELQCRGYLENAEKQMTLPDFEHLVADSDLETIRDKSWFQELLARQKSRS
jgi:Tfp pilus assembly protein PilF